MQSESREDGKSGRWEDWKISSFMKVIEYR